jgi:hypothetical protein
MTRSRSFLALVVLVPLATLLLGCPSPGGSTPEETFEKFKQFVKEEKYDEVWNLMTDKFRRQRLEECAKQKQVWRNIIANDPGNVEQTNRMLEPQMGMTIQEALKLTDRELQDLGMARSREIILGYRIVGEPRIRGKIALMEIAIHESAPKTITWRLVKRGAGWLFDGGPKQDVMTPTTGPKRPR